MEIKQMSLDSSSPNLVTMMYTSVLSSLFTLVNVSELPVPTNILLDKLQELLKLAHSYENLTQYANANATLTLLDVNGQAAIRLQLWDDIEGIELGGYQVVLGPYKLRKRFAIDITNWRIKGDNVHVS